jgi:hypothetical protein
MISLYCIISTARETTGFMIKQRNEFDKRVYFALTKL